MKKFISLIATVAMVSSLFVSVAYADVNLAVTTEVSKVTNEDFYAYMDENIPDGYDVYQLNVSLSGLGTLESAKKAGKLKGTMLFGAGYTLTFGDDIGDVDSDYTMCVDKKFGSSPEGVDTDQKRYTINFSTGDPATAYPAEGVTISTGTIEDAFVIWVVVDSTKEVTAAVSADVTIAPVDKGTPGEETQYYAASANLTPSEITFATEGPTKHTITFVDEDGTTVLDTVEVNDGETPSTSVTPTKAGYTFAGWTPAIAAATGNATYTATYTVNNYTITFVDEDGTTVLDTKQVAYGATPSTAVTPTKAGYTFAGWTPAIAAVTGDATYTATYEQILYTVTFTDENDSVIKTDNLVPGASIVKPANPTKANAVFVGWSADGGVSVANVPATADKAYTFKAVFKNIPAPVEKEAGAATFKTYTKGEEVVSGVTADADYVAADATLTEVDNTLFRYKVVLTGTNKTTGAEETQEFDDIEFGTGAGDGEVELSGATAKLMVIVKAIKHNITKIAIKALGR